MSRTTPLTPRRGDASTPARSASWVKTLAMAGPAFVVGAWQFGPGNLTTAVQAGSRYDYTLVWVIAVSTILMIFFTDMSVRLGIATPTSLITSIKDHLGKWVGVLAGFGVVTSPRISVTSASIRRSPTRTW